MRVIRLFMIVLFLSSCGGEGERASAITARDACGEIGLSPKIVGGSTCSTDTASPVVEIHRGVRDALGERFVLECTGSLVSRRYVLTAAHCFQIDPLYPPQVSKAAVGFGKDASPRLIRAKRIVIHPQYARGENNLLENDAAILELEEAVDASPLPLFLSGSPLAGAIGDVYGYGLTAGDADSNSAGNLLSGQMRIKSVNDTHIFSKYDGNGVNVCFGDSGGPMVLVEEDRVGIVGIVSQSTRTDCAPGDVTAFTRVDVEPVASWILGTAESAFSQ